MSVLDEAIEVLRASEQKLRVLIAQAAEKGEYDYLSLLTEWAKHLNALPDSRMESRNTALVNGSGEHLTPHAGNEVSNQTRPAEIADRKSGSRKEKPAKRNKRARKGNRKKSEYPKFLREGEALVKVGWSKRDGKPYEHKAPRRVLQALIRVVAKAGVGGKRFTAEDLFPLIDPVNHSEIPDYQAYLTLAWLRGTGLIVQHGRQGYSLAKTTDLDRDSDRLWNALPSR